MAKVHIGKKIKEVVDNSPVSVTDFASRINRSRDIAYKIFKRETIDTGLLQQISKVLEHNFFRYYGNEQLPMVKEEIAAYGKMAFLTEELKVSKKQLSELEKKYELLEKVNKLTEEKLESLKGKNKKIK